MEKQENVQKQPLTETEKKEAIEAIKKQKLGLLAELEAILKIDVNYNNSLLKPFLGIFVDDERSSS